MGYTVEDLKDRMTSEEFAGWREFHSRRLTDFMSPELYAMREISYSLALIDFRLRRAPLVWGDKTATAPDYNLYFPKRTEKKEKVNHEEKMKGMSRADRRKYLKEISRPEKQLWAAILGQTLPEGE